MSDFEVKKIRFGCQANSNVPIGERKLSMHFMVSEAGEIQKERTIYFEKVMNKRGQKIDDHILGENITNSLRNYIFFLRFALERRKVVDEQVPLKLSDFDNLRSWKDGEPGSRKTKFFELCKSSLITKKNSGYVLCENIEVAIDSPNDGIAGICEWLGLEEGEYTSHIRSQNQSDDTLIDAKKIASGMSFKGTSFYGYPFPNLDVLLGDGTYQMKFTREFTGKRFSIPDEKLRLALEYAKNRRKKIYIDKGYANNDLARLDSFIPPWEQTGDCRVVKLRFSITDYYSYLTTNRSLREPLIPAGGKDITIAELLNQHYQDIKGSYLANPCAVHTQILTNTPTQQPQMQIIVSRRSMSVESWKGLWCSPAAGFMAVHRANGANSHLDDEGVPDPLICARDEVSEEVKLQLTPEELADYRFLALSILREDYDLNLVGYVELRRSAQDILRTAPDRSESSEWLRIGGNTPQDLVKAVVANLQDNEWEPVSAFGLLCLCVHRFGRSLVEYETKRVFGEVNVGRLSASPVPLR